MKLQVFVFQVVIFFCCSVVVSAQQLRTEYTEIRLSDKRVFSRARVESFDGVSFCISHTGGIEAAVSWDLMPPDWKTAFPYSTERKMRLRDIARSKEENNPQAKPGSLKPSSRSQSVSNESAGAKEKGNAENGRLLAFQRAVFEQKVLPGMTQDQCLQAWGKPLRVEQVVTESGVDHWWYYSEDRKLYLFNGVLRTVHGSITAPEPESTPRLTRSW